MPQIVTIPALPMGMLNAYLLVANGRAVLVDTGLPGTAAMVARLLARHGLGWDALTAVILTHGHIDHAGAAAEIARLTKAPVYAHADELPYLAGSPPLIRPTGPFGLMFKRTGLIERPFEAVTVDNPIPGSEETVLAPWPGEPPLRLLPTPGHTPGSLSVILEGGRVLAGDLLASGILLGGIAFRGHTKQPPFEEDTRQVLRSLAALLDRGAREFYLGHGGPVSRQQVERHMIRLRRQLA